MSNTATIYRHFIHEAPTAWETGEGWSLEPWGCNTAFFKGEDDGGKLYRLPAGLHVAEDRFGIKGLYRDGETQWSGLPVENISKDGRDIPYIPGYGACTLVEDAPAV